MTNHGQFLRIQEVDEVILCALCKDSWNMPVELEPCGHIFCESCLNGYEHQSSSILSLSSSGNEWPFLCPTCKCKAKKNGRPNRLLVNRALEVEVKCRRCQWKGTREQSQGHACSLENPLGISSVSEGLECTSHTVEAELNLVRDHYEEISLSLRIPPSQNAADAPSLQRPLNEEEVWKKYGLSQVAYDQFVSLFMAHDTRNCGFLTREQFRSLVFDLNFVNGDEGVDRMMLEMGCDRSGGILMSDLFLWLKNHSPNPEAFYGLSQVEYNEALLQFRSYDHKNRRCLHWNSFKALCLSHGYAKHDAEAWDFFLSCTKPGETSATLLQFILFRKRLRDLHESSGSGGLLPLPPSEISMPTPPSRAHRLSANNRRWFVRRRTTGSSSRPIRNEERKRACAMM